MSPPGSGESSQPVAPFELMMEKTKSGSLLPDEVAHLLDAFLPSSDLDVRSKAYLVLSSFFQSARTAAFDRAKANDAGKETILQVLGPPILDRLGDPGEKKFLSGICSLMALFQVDWEAAAMIFTSEGLLDTILDQADTSPPSSLPHIARLLSQAAGHKQCRSAFTPPIIEWLEKSLKQTTIIALRAAGGVTLVKLSRNTGTADSVGVPPSVQTPNEDAAFYRFIVDIALSSSDSSSISDAVEALVYLSTNPELKEKISADPKLLSKLFAQVPRGKQLNRDAGPEQSTLIYGVVVVISQLCAYPPRMTEEQVQIEKLKQMAKSGRKSEGKETSPYDGSDYVIKRISRLITAGVLEVLVAASYARSDSVGVRVTVGKAILSIAEAKENRGKILQHGGAKALSQTIKRGLNDQSSMSSELDAGYLDAIQVLAKLAITASPVQVFGPSEAAMYDVIRPFSILLQHSSSSLLQRFEALMALTNLSSQSTELSSRIAKAEGVVNKLELMMLEDHVLVRRASVELLCNLIAGSDEVFERYGGSNPSPNAESKLEILIALSDVEDIPTKLAASGALATLTISEPVCAMLADLQLKKHRMFTILANLIDPEMDGAVVSQRHSGILHRGIVCIRNIVATLDTSKRRELLGEMNSSGLAKALVGVAPSVPAEAMDAFQQILVLLRSP